MVYRGSEGYLLTLLGPEIRRSHTLEGREDVFVARIFRISTSKPGEQPFCVVLRSAPAFGVLDRQCE